MKIFMKRLFCALMAMTCAAVHAAHAVHPEETVEGAKFFEMQVRPILANRCYECHGEKKQKGGLRVDGIGFLKAGGDTGPALVAGDPDKSPMIEAVRYQNADFQMPPKGALSAGEVAALEKWVKMGAPWPQTDAQATPVLEGGFTAEQRAYWFFHGWTPLGFAATSTGLFYRNSARREWSLLLRRSARSWCVGCTSICMACLRSPRRRRVSLPTRLQTPTNSLWIACSQVRATDSAGRSTGWIWCGMRRATATTRTHIVQLRGGIETG